MSFPSRPLTDPLLRPILSPRLVSEIRPQLLQSPISMTDHVLLHPIHLGVRPPLTLDRLENRIPPKMCRSSSGYDVALRSALEENWWVTWTVRVGKCAQCCGGCGGKAREEGIQTWSRRGTKIIPLASKRTFTCLKTDLHDPICQESP